MNNIFVQIASYRDPQLIPTLKSMIENAKNPKKLIIGICRQYHPDDKFDVLDEYKNDKRFRVTDVLYSESKGVCWARNQVQQLYGGEDYTLQIDSHMRFEKNWDDTFIKMIKQLQKKGFEKPLLTGYVSSFNPENDPEQRIREPWRMAFDRFIPEGAVFFLPESIPGWQDLKEPVPARFYSAHFCFTLGKFSVEVQHDPEFYFHGEEISIAVRAFTHGYDLFHPHKVAIWHEYTRKGRTKQWDDDKEWGIKNSTSHKKNRQLFGMDGEEITMDFSKYGFGTERSLKDYEIYSGLLFSKRAIQQHTLDKNYPPNPTIYETEEEWINSFSSIFKHCVDIGFHQVPEKDYDFWVVAFHNEKDETIFRKDADINEIKRMMNDPDNYCKVWREFPTTQKPKYWVVWPHSESKGWCDRITGNL
jgi:glycosyltransferase involved in cell wall biosynthesis